nr:hypothetical protein [Mycobacterium senriense]
MTEKPEPDEDAKKKASEMMEAYKEKPTIVLPGTGGSVSGTAVNEWLDEDGNPKHEEPEGSDAQDSDAQDSDAQGSDAQDSDAQDSDAQGSDAQEKGDGQRDEEALNEQIEKDKTLNEKLREAAKAENKGEDD